MFKIRNILLYDVAPFLPPKTITKTIQLFSEFKKQNKIKSKFLGVKMCPFLCYFSNGWTWKFKDYQKMICLPPSLNNSTPNQTYLTTELWNGKNEKTTKVGYWLQNHIFEFYATYLKNPFFFKKLMMSHDFFTQNWMTNTIQPFSESKKTKQNKIKILPPKICPLLMISFDVLDLEI
jgi:hypothetical protein